MKICFFSSKSYVIDSFNKVNKKYNYQLSFYNVPISKETVSLAKNCEVVSLFVNDSVDRELLQILKDNGCKMIALRCAGFNNIDIRAAKEIGIHVVRVPMYSPYAVAEHAFALMLSLNRKIHKAYNRVRDTNFDIVGLLGFDFNGKTIGVVGTGTIGQVFIKIAKGFGMNVIAYDPYPKHEVAEQLGFKYVDLETELYKESDIIALHCPLTEDNKYMINAHSISLMKDNVMIINTSRGGLINTKELLRELKKGKLGSVGLDVYEEEENYFFSDFSDARGIDDDVLARLLSYHNVLVTSHQAFFTEEALDNIASTTFDNIESYFVNKNLKNIVSI